MDSFSAGYTHIPIQKTLQDFLYLFKKKKRCWETCLEMLLSGNNYVAYLII